MNKKITCLLLALMLSACAGTAFTWESARQLKEGMTEQEVTELMGPPYLVSSTAGGLTWVWSYAETFAGARTVSVVFMDGKVAKAPVIPASFK